MEEVIVSRRDDIILSCIQNDLDDVLIFTGVGHDKLEKVLDDMGTLFSRVPISMLELFYELWFQKEQIIEVENITITCVSIWPRPGLLRYKVLVWDCWSFRLR